MIELSQHNKAPVGSSFFFYSGTILSALKNQRIDTVEGFSCHCQGWFDASLFFLICIYIRGINHSLENLYLLYVHKPVFVPISIERHGCENVISLSSLNCCGPQTKTKPHTTSRQFPHVGNIRKIIALLNAPLVYILDLAYLLIQLPYYQLYGDQTRPRGHHRSRTVTFYHPWLCLHSWHP